MRLRLGYQAVGSGGLGIWTEGTGGLGGWVSGIVAGNYVIGWLGLRTGGWFWDSGFGVWSLGLGSGGLECDKGEVVWGGVRGLRLGGFVEDMGVLKGGNGSEGAWGAEGFGELGDGWWDWRDCFFVLLGVRDEVYFAV